jgi:pimeloyl-ACP methyl ester carboxylesterase
MRSPLWRLLYWLGPWMPGHRFPADVVQRDVQLPRETSGGQDYRPMRIREMKPANGPCRGTYLVAPGLHYLGPDDPRFDRFLRILAHAGYLVWSPFLPDYINLSVAKGVIPDFARALKHLLDHPDRPQNLKPAVFSISFGSLPALRLAADPATKDELGGLILFGGYANITTTLAYALGSRDGHMNMPKSDPLNRPVLFTNLLDCMNIKPELNETIRKSLLSFIHQTWGVEAQKNPDRKLPESYLPIAEKLRDQLPEHLRDAFWLACGLSGDYQSHCEDLLKAHELPSFMDPLPHVSQIRCPVHLFHGRDDDVIPFQESLALEKAMAGDVQVKCHLTGLYNHTEKPSLIGLLQVAPKVPGEINSLVSMLRAMVHVASEPTSSNGL